MALISNVARLVNGIVRQVDLSTNTLVVSDLQIGGVLLTGTSGSTKVGDAGGYSNFTPLAATVRGALQGIDSALASSGATQTDSTFRIQNFTDNTKKIAFDASGISTGTVRTITMPDSNVNLGLIGTAIQRNGSVAFTANQPMAGFKFTGLGAGSGAGDSVRYEQAILASGANAWSANQSLGGFKITNAADPTSAQDYVTKAYADSLAAGLDPKASVRAATAAALPAVTYNNGASGVGATLTANANGALAAQDGVTLIVGNRLLVKNQVAALQNGIYTVTDLGSAGTPFILTRATDQDGSPASEVSGGNFTFVEAGTTQSGSGWSLIWDGNVVIGTDPLNWSQFSSITFIGGDMITITGNTISVDLASTSGLESTNPGNIAGQLRIKLEASNPSLRFTGSNELAAKLDPAGAITSGASGLVAAVDGVSLEISSNAHRIKTTAYDQATITGGGGSAAAVQYAPAVRETFTVGESIAATTAFAVRMAKAADAGFVAGRVYKADNDATSVDNFWVIGVVYSAGALTAGQTALVTKAGVVNIPSHGFTIGSPVWLGVNGVLTNTAPTTANFANLKIGMVRDANNIEVQIGSPNVY